MTSIAISEPLRPTLFVLGDKMARPKKIIDWETVKKLCAIHCTGEEIASIVDVSYDTLERHIKAEFAMSFADFYKKHSSNGKMSLRRKQYEVAMSGNTTMLVWLGKQYLGQTDKTESNVKAEVSTLSDLIDELSDE